MFVGGQQPDVPPRCFFCVSGEHPQLRLSPRPLTISAGDYIRDQGDANPLFAATAVGFASGDSSADLSGTLALTTTANTGSATGIYAIMPSGQTSRNYTITYVDGVLTVLPPTAAEQPSSAITRRPPRPDLQTWSRTSIVRCVQIPSPRGCMLSVAECACRRVCPPTLQRRPYKMLRHKDVRL